MFDFSPNLDTLENVPENFHGLYVKGESGAYSIHPDFATHTSGLKSALDKERKSNRDREKALKAWSDLGETPEAVTATLTELKEALAKKGNDGVNIDKIKADMEKSYGDKLAEKDKVNSRLQASINKYLIESAATQEIAAAKGVPALLLPIIRQMATVVEENGEYTVRILDADKDYRSNGKGGFMSISDLVAELKTHKDYSRAFEASGNTGGGKPSPSSTGKGAGSQPTGQNLSPVSKIASGLRKGQLTNQ